MNLNINLPEKLKLREATDIGQCWKQFKQAWQIYEIASGCINNEEIVRLATFLHIGGPEAVEKYNTFSWNNEEDKNNLQKVIEKFDNDCKITTNVLLERNKFFRRKQKANESCDKYVAELRLLCASCEFISPEEHLRDQFALNIYNERAQERLLEIAQQNLKSLTFDKAIATVRNFEKTRRNGPSNEHHDEAMEVDMNVYKIKDDGNSHKMKRNQCSRCGTVHAYKQCPAFGRTCGKCGIPNHFAKMCKAKHPTRKQKHNVNAVEDDVRVNEDENTPDSENDAEEMI